MGEAAEMVLDAGLDAWIEHELAPKPKCPWCGKPEARICDSAGLVEYDEHGATGTPYRCPNAPLPTSETSDVR